jgi:hypothetical protein
VAQLRKSRFAPPRPKGVLARLRGEKKGGPKFVDLHLPANDPDRARPRSRALPISPFVLVVGPDPTDRTRAGSFTGQYVATQNEGSQNTPAQNVTSTVENVGTPSETIPNVTTPNVATPNLTVLGGWSEIPGLRQATGEQGGGTSTNSKRV